MKYTPTIVNLRSVPQGNPPARGLGDLVQSVTNATGISWVVRRVAKARGKGCGCGARRDKLNNVFRGEQ